MQERYLLAPSHTNSIGSAFENGRDLGYKFEMGEVVAKALDSLKDL
jgi:hypothetical protein